MTDSPHTHIDDDRPLNLSLWRGWRCKCPNCGEGPLLFNYLKVRESCSICHEDYTAQRADDGPAYLTILVVGHVMISMLFWVFTQYRPDPLVLFSIFAVGSVALSLFLLPRFKGGVVAFQWSRRMHGFDKDS